MDERLRRPSVIIVVHLFMRSVIQKVNNSDTRFHTTLNIMFSVVSTSPYYISTGSGVHLEATCLRPMQILQRGNGFVHVFCWLLYIYKHVYRET
jgi:hypothetical protein